MGSITERRTQEVLAAARPGSAVSLLAGLNAATSPRALKAIDWRPRRFVEPDDGGLLSNSEATSGSTGKRMPTKLKLFATTHPGLPHPGPRPRQADRDCRRAGGAGQHQRGEHGQSYERIFLEGLRRQVYEQHQPAFNEVTAPLLEHNFQLANAGVANETNWFLNWVQLTYAPGDETWGRRRPLRVYCRWFSFPDLNLRVPKPAEPEPIGLV
jgi:hypothetical protein